MSKVKSRLSGLKSKFNKNRQSERVKPDKTVKFEVEGDGIGREEKNRPSKAIKKIKKPNRIKKTYDRLYSKVGYTEIFVKGKGAFRALKTCSGLYKLRDVRVASDGVYFCAGAKDCDKIIAILTNLCYDYKIINRRGLGVRAMNVLSRVGVAVGIFAALIGIALYPHFVTKIEIAGASDNALKSDIQGILASEGIVTGAFLGRTDFSSLEKDLLALDRVAYAGVRRFGTHIVVTVKEELKTESFVDIKGSAVRSDAIATVTRVVVTGGTAVVKYGDVVRPGDTLIDGYVMYGDDKIFVEASGVVYGKTIRRKTAFFEDVASVKKEGRVKNVTKLSFFGMPVKAPEKPFENCSVSVTVSELGFMLPVKIYTYRFCEEVFEELTNDRTEQQMIEEVYSQILPEMGSASAIEKHVTLQRADGGVYVTVAVEAEEIISNME